MGERTEIRERVGNRGIWEVVHTLGCREGSTTPLAHLLPGAVARGSKRGLRGERAFFSDLPTRPSCSHGAEQLPQQV